MTQPSIGLLVRCAALGLAAGSRASLGVAGPVLSGRRRGRAATVLRTAVALGVAAELVGDKQPTTPSRLDPPGPASRAASGALGATLLARRAGSPTLLPALVGGAGGFAGTLLGAGWRTANVGRRPDLQAALAEDVAALTLAALACLPGREPATEVTTVVVHEADDDGASGGGGTVTA